jgi:peroxisomal membrane protein 4
VQIVLYLLGRILVGLVTLAYKELCKERWGRRGKPFERRWGHFLLAACCWGLVMWLFTVDRSVLQSSLSGSMEFLYLESNKALKNWRELVPFHVPKF